MYVDMIIVVGEKRRFFFLEGGLNRVKSSNFCLIYQEG